MSAAITPAENETTPVNNDKLLPNSRRIYIDGNQTGVRVPFREISQKKTRSVNYGIEENRSVRVYDTSGPWGDPSVRYDVREGLPTLRRHWILARGDVEEYQGRDLQPIDDGYLTFDAANHARRKEKGRLEDFPALPCVTNTAVNHSERRSRNTSPLNSYAMKSLAVGRSFPQTSITPKASR